MRGEWARLRSKGLARVWHGSDERQTRRASRRVQHHQNPNEVPVQGLGRAEGGLVGPVERRVHQDEDGPHGGGGARQGRVREGSK